MKRSRYLSGPNSTSERAGKRTAAIIEPTTDPKLVQAFLEQGWALLGAGRDQEATQLSVRTVRLQETDDTREFFVACIKRWKAIPGTEAIRDIIVRALREVWAEPHELFHVVKGMLKLDAVFGPAMRRATTAWPRRLSLPELLGPAGLAQIAADPLLAALLERGSILDLDIERTLTSLRAGLLDTLLRDRGSHNQKILGLCCALAQQCYINEYVFDLTAEESDRVHGLRDRVHRALETHAAISPIEIALLAAYFPLDGLPAEELLKRSWPQEVDGLIELQISTPAAERTWRASIPQLTPIAADMSVRVRHQYEHNPFPRWVKLPARRPMPFDEWMPRLYPSSRFRSIGKGDNLDVLIGGCGTGRHSIMLAQTLPSAKILAVDLSMSSLCYAKEKTRARGLTNIDYAQADILELGNLERRFDIVSSSGVLHHTADPEKGWRTLLRLLRPDGCMQIGLYSERAHRNVYTVQRWLSERGFSSSVEDIRRARQQLADAGKTDAALASALSFSVFFSTSEFRDLFRPTEMHRFTIPRIRQFLDDNDLEFIGFVIADEIRQKFWTRFSRQADADLGLWDQFEAEYPDAFKGMYEFWSQKKRAA